MKKPKVENLSEEILRKSMEQKQKERAEACNAELLKVLEKHQCDIVIAVQLGSSAVQAGEILKVPTVWGVVAK